MKSPVLRFSLCNKNKLFERIRRYENTILHVATYAINFVDSATAAKGYEFLLREVLLNIRQIVTLVEMKGIYRI